MLKDVGKLVTVVRIYQEDVETGMAGNLLFEYEVPLNVEIEKLTSDFTALSFLDKGEFVGFHFSTGDADCSSFTMMLKDLAEKLINDATESTALKEVSRAREKNQENAAKKLCDSIDMDVLRRGDGSADHERELYKLLASADIGMEDLSKPETLE